MSDFLLYNYFRSSTSYRVRIALHHKKIAFEYKPVHLLNQGGEQHFEAYKKLNPMQEVPTLVHKDKVISQSMAIIEYLEEINPEPPIFPKDPYIKAKVRQFCENINCGIHPLQNLKVIKMLETELKATSEQKSIWLKTWIERGFESIEKMLSDFSGTYSFGEKITAADIFLTPQVFSAERFGVSLKSFSNIERVHKNCLELEAFKRAHPLNQVDTPEDLKTNP